ncbi:MAG TPA: L-histidine N(alpha)-methyltransferase, partial [Gemmataceae bacterium]|nr:L-histidine N(alpha)-methyltransferase [Gemmataceae bacterium]
MGMPNSTDRFTMLAIPSSTRLATLSRDVKAGLTGHPKCLSCCYFYDQEGSQLFEEICELPEYYLPKAEREILQTNAAEIAAVFPEEFTVVELGSGNAAKTRILLEAFLADREKLKYVPIDICRTVLEDSSRDLLRDFPKLEIVAFEAEYQEAMRNLPVAGNQPKLILWLGSNVGNFDRNAAANFLRNLQNSFSPSDRLLIGIDLRKDRATLEQAYDDSRGVTAQFNLNLLTRINRELGGHFDLQAFCHRAIYNEPIGRIEMYLVSTINQTVLIDQLGFKAMFEKGETIFTESSFKYSLDEI